MLVKLMCYQPMIVVPLYSDCECDHRARKRSCMICWKIVWKCTIIWQQRRWRSRHMIQHCSPWKMFCAANQTMLKHYLGKARYSCFEFVQVWAFCKMNHERKWEVYSKIFNFGMFLEKKKSQFKESIYYHVHLNGISFSKAQNKLSLMYETFYIVYLSCWLNWKYEKCCGPYF